MLCGGRLLDGSSQLADALPQHAAAAEPQRLELLCPPACAAAGATGGVLADLGDDPYSWSQLYNSKHGSDAWELWLAAATSSAVGRVRVAGRLEGFAFVPRRELLAAAVAALQADLVISLRHRLEVRCAALHRQCCTFMSVLPISYQIFLMPTQS